MPRHRRSGSNYPQGGGQVTNTGEGSDPFGDFPGQPDLGGFGGGAGGGGGINIVNTAIAQAINESGPGGVSAGPITGGGIGGGGNHHMPGGHHPGGGHHGGGGHHRH